MEAIVLNISSIVKARSVGADGRRIIEVEASNESVDAEGDIILQSALLNSAPSFVRSGHIDIDHISELGLRVGIQNPTSYIIGRPLEVKDLGDKRTGIVGEIMRSRDGSFSPENYKYDEFWKSLQSEPPVLWSSSIYGYPLDGMMDDCSDKYCASGATRYIVRGIDWRSLAMTRCPVNQSLTGYAKIVTAKAQVELMRKDMILPFGMGGQGMIPDALGQNPNPAYNLPKSVDALWGQYENHIVKECSYYRSGMDSTTSFCDHFKSCCGADPEMADVLSHALMWMVTKNRYQGTMI